MRFSMQELRGGFRIGKCLVQPLQNRITCGAADVRLEPRVMDVLVCLAANAGEVVSRETLNADVWRDVVVTDQAVTNCISELRHHLGDDRSTNRIIETIPKRGYRLIASVELAAAAPVVTPGPAAPAPKPEPQPGPPPVPRPARSSRLRAVVVAATLSIGGLLAAAWWWQRASAPVLTSVAVLPFENAAADDTLDYLALALADEISTLLTHSRGLAVRPLGFVSGKDPLADARDRRVDHVVSGRFYPDGEGHLTLAIEAQHVRQERVIWRTRITAPAGDLVAIRGRLTEGLRQGLLPALGAAAQEATAQQAWGNTPAHDEAYRLYLRSLAIPQQPQTGEQAIEMLERVVAIEPQFAPAWQALGVRYYAFGTWWAGGTPARQKSLDAHRKALQLDPQLIDAARNIVTHRVETGDLAGAYHDARQLLDRFGPGPETHFTVAYVYRYGGLLEESQRHCELALDRDPRDPRLRSCGYAYLYAGELDRVMDFFRLDEGSYFVQWATVLYLLRRDDSEAALKVVRQTADEPTRRLMEPCLAGVRGAALDAVSQEFFDHWHRRGDPETGYALAPMLMYCGRAAEALRLVERGVDGQYCAYPALDLDPIWAPVRHDPEFQRIRAKGLRCHEGFRRAVAAYDRASNP